MATYLEELHDLFPNGLHALAPRAAEKDGMSCRFVEDWYALLNQRNSPTAHLFVR